MVRGARVQGARAPGRGRLPRGCGWLAATLLVAGCALDQDTPDRACVSDQDCLVAQGERCDQETRRCEAGPDAGDPGVAPSDRSSSGEASGGAPAAADDDAAEVTP